MYPLYEGFFLNPAEQKSMEKLRIKLIGLHMIFRLNYCLFMMCGLLCNQKYIESSFLQIGEKAKSGGGASYLIRVLLYLVFEVNWYQYINIH